MVIHCGCSYPCTSYLRSVSLCFRLSVENVACIPMYITFPTHPLYLITLIVLHEEYCCLSLLLFIHFYAPNFVALVLCHNLMTGTSIHSDHSRYFVICEMSLGVRKDSWLLQLLHQMNIPCVVNQELTNMIIPVINLLFSLFSWENIPNYKIYVW